MRKFVVSLLMIPVLGACGKGGGGAGGAGSGEVSGGGLGADFYKQFEMKAKVDCAGLRRSFTYMEGRQNYGGTEVELTLRIAGNGSYQAYIYEGAAPARHINGRWRREASLLRFEGLGTARGESFAGKKSFLKFTPDQNVIAAALAGEAIPLFTRYEENDSGMMECSPADNARMVKNAAGEITIDGAAAAAFWPEAFKLGSEPRARSGNWGETSVKLNVHPDGTFLYREVRDFNVLAEVAGTWIYQDGLVVLQDLGVLTPYSGEPGGYLYPYLYLSHDPATRIKVRGRFKSVALPGYSH